MRQLPAELEAVLASGTRRPAFKLLAYDPSLDTISAIVRGEATQEPFDLSPYCSDISWSPAQMSFTLADPGTLFNPDTGSARAYLVDKAIVRLLEGDDRVNQDYWMWSFTGLIQGQVGWTKSRRSKKMEGKVTVNSRESITAYKKRTVTTKEYTVGTDAGLMLADVCEQFLGVTAEERRIPQVLGLQLLHNINQLSQVTPWAGISAILETVSRIPYFDGEGKLTTLNQNLHRPTDRVLPDYVKIVDYLVPARNQDYCNRVEVKFLDANMSRVDGDPQKLGSASITTGFFTGSEQIKCYWSEDRRQRAAATYLKEIKSINSNGLGLPVGSVDYQQDGEFSGTILITIAAWVPALVVSLMAGYIAAAWLPDEVVVAGIGGSAGFTIPVGRAVQAALLIGILLTMMSLGSCTYEVWGTPFDYVYLEKRAVAVEDGLDYWDENPRVIENDFLGSIDQARPVAMTQLIWEESNASPRQLVIENDLAVEKGDIVQVPDGRKFLITDLSKTIKRGEIPSMTLQGFKVRTA